MIVETGMLMITEKVEANWAKREKKKVLVVCQTSIEQLTLKKA